MKRKFVIVAAVCVLLVIIAAITIVVHFGMPDKMTEMLNQLETAMGDGWKKQSVTKVFRRTYSDGEGNTIVYYVCATAYYEEDPSGQAGLNTDAISAVIPAEEAESSRTCTVSGHPAAVYQKNGRTYLCWTLTPELSCVIAYDPAVVSEGEIRAMAESVPFSG